MLTNQELNDRQLKWFGLSLGGLIAVFGGIAYWKFSAEKTAWGLVIVAVVLTIIYYVIPSTRRPIFRVFRMITYPIQLVMTFVVLGIVYYGLLTPIGWIMRLRGLNLSKKSDAESLWNQRDEDIESSRYFKTY